MVPKIAKLLLDTLEKAVHYAELLEKNKDENHTSASLGILHRSPLLQESEIALESESSLLRDHENWNKLRDKLTDPKFDTLKDDMRYRSLLTRTKV